MQTTAGSGKYLTRKWQEDRARALIDRSQFTTDELAWLEIGADDGIVSSNDPNIYQIPTQPVDPLTGSRSIDMRKALRRD